MTRFEQGCSDYQNHGFLCEKVARTGRNQSDSCGGSLLQKSYCQRKGRLFLGAGPSLGSIGINLLAAPFLPRIGQSGIGNDFGKCFSFRLQ